MTAMRALELPAVELPAELAGGEPEFPAAARPRETAVRRAAARWARPGPAPARGQAPASRTPASPQAAPLRLTRRGRVVVAVLAAMVLAVLSLVITLSAQATSQPGPAHATPGVTQVTVLPGQSLWAVAEKADPRSDTRAVVQRIVQLNSLSGSVVYAGQQLWVPRG